MFDKSKFTTRDQWHNSVEFHILRMLNNGAASVQYRAQECNDVVNVIAALVPELVVCDKLTVVQQQVRIVTLEASNLWDKVRKLNSFLEPSDLS